MSNINLAENSIPDFEDMMNVAEKIRDTSLRKTKLELKIDDLVSKTVVKVTTDPAYFTNGKPPSMSFVNSTYLVTGINGDIMALRERLAELESELEYLKNKLYIYREIIDVWRTMSANKRASVM